MDWTKLYCSVDDFCQQWEPLWRSRQLASGERKRRRVSSLSTSEIMTIVIVFHSSNYRDFKHFYLMLLAQHRAEFPGLVSYGRFVKLIPSVLAPMCAYLPTRFGTCTGISCIDSTSIAVCGNKRLSRNLVFQGLAARGKTTMGWFYGFKLHLVINEVGELLAFHLTSGNVNDREPVPKLALQLIGKLFGDKGYITAKLFEELWEQGVQLITQIRRNMKNKLMPLMDTVLLRKRSLIETVNDQLKNIAQIEHTRHRSSVHFMVNLLAALTSYTHQPKKPSINLTDNQRNSLESKQLLGFA
jgi:hypothetical protein